MISKFLSGLTPGKRAALAAAAAVLFALAFYFLLLGPSRARLESLDRKIAAEKEIINKNAQVLARQDSMVREADAFKDFYASRERGEDEVKAEFFKGLESMPGNLLVKSDGQEYEKESVRYFALVECSGTMDEITSFVYAVNNSPMLLRVEKMSIASNARDQGKLTATLRVSRLIVSSDPKKDARALVKVKEVPPAAAPDAGNGPASATTAP